MTHVSTPILLELHSAESLSSQIAALRKLKNETVGHGQRKELWIRGGIISILSKILALRRTTERRTGVQDLNGTVELRESLSSRSEEEDACLQAIIIVGSLAQGGPSFLSPIFSSDILPTLLSILASPNSPRSPLCLPILRTLNNIADRLPLQSHQQWPKDTRLADLIFSKDCIGCLARIIAQDYDSQQAQASIELAASLIGKLCTEETHKAALAESGTLDALATKVASFVVAQGFVLPADRYLQGSGAPGALPPPAPSTAKLSPILRSVTVIVEHSKWRAEHFLSSPGIVAVFPKQLPGFAPADIKKGPWGSTYLSGSAVPHHFAASPIDYLLPSVPLAQSKSSTTNFPPLGHQGSHGRHSHSFTAAPSVFDAATSEEDESAVIPWLLYLARSESGMTRLMAARFVTALFRLGLARKYRVSMFSVLLIPILVRMLDKDYLSEDDNVEYGGLTRTTEHLKEEAPAVLATLVIDDQELQKQAVDCGAIKRLSRLLKESYNPIHENSQPMWDADGSEDMLSPSGSLPPESRLGPPGYSPIVCHIMRYRENVLKALAALVPFKDEYRKAVCENGVVPYIIDSLKPRSSEPPADISGPHNTAADGNPTATLLAACGAARMLTRSVSVLRTSLIDAGVAAPLFVLIKHPDIDVQVAATSVICNLALDFSPMKEAIISADILPILCDHAHSSNTKLRLESLWALKHVVYNSANDIKVKIIEALGPEWIKHIIGQDPASALTKRGLEEGLDNGSSLGMSRANSAGEQVDLLNPMEEDDDIDVDDDNGDGDDRDREEDFKMTDTMPSSRMSLGVFLPDARRRRKLTLNGDLDQTTQARQDDIAVQEQTFDLIRNIICGPGSSEMIDYLFREIGQNEIFDALSSKLRPRTIQLPHRRDSSNSRLLHVPTEIIVAVTFVIIHIAAGLPRHRQYLLSHGELMRNLMGYFNHPHRDVRANCVWVAINLTYEDDQSDRDGCRDRALKLKSFGIMERLASLEDDPDLDVRERTKTANHLLNSLGP